jgi:hypothetical protein
MSMKSSLKSLHAVLLILLVLSICGCQGDANGPTSDDETQQEPSGPSEGQVDEGAMGDEPEGDPGGEPAPGDGVGTDWTTTASTLTELSYGFPGEWIGPAELPSGDGFYIKHPDKDVGMIIVLGLQGDPTELALEWSNNPYEVVGLVTIVGNPLPLTAPILISRLQGMPVSVEGDLMAQSFFIQRADDLMQLIFYTPADEWEGWQDTFDQILASMEVWKTIIFSDMQTMMLHDWKGPMMNWEQEGFWVMSEDLNAGMIIFTGPIADPVEVLAAWSPDRLATMEYTECSVEDGDGMQGMGGDWESKIGYCNGGEVTFEVAYMANRDRVLEVITYANTDTWEYHTGIFETMLAMFSDLRP